MSGYVLRWQEHTHVGTAIQRLDLVQPDGSTRERWRVARDETHYAMAANRTAALRAAMRPGALDVEREPLEWVTEPARGRLFDVDKATR